MLNFIGISHNLNNMHKDHLHMYICSYIRAYVHIHNFLQSYAGNKAKRVNGSEWYVTFNNGRTNATLNISILAITDMNFNFVLILKV